MSNIIANHTVFETRVNAYLSTLVYAALKDIGANWNSALPFPDDVWQSYDNFCAAKEHKLKRKNVFTIAPEVKQMIGILYTKMIGELREVTITTADKPADIVAKLSSVCDLGYTEFIWKFGTYHSSKFGSSLQRVGDTAQWFSSQIAGAFNNKITSGVVLGMIWDEFDRFLKAVAWLVATILWYNSQSFSGGLLLSLLAQQAPDQMLIDELVGNIRPREPKKQRAGKAPVAGFSDEIAPADDEDGENPN